MKKLNNLFLLFVIMLGLLPNIAKAQPVADTIRWWNLASYSEETVANLAADTERWEEGWKSGKLIRYMNKVTSDGNTLMANGQVIKELEGLLIGAGIDAGSLLLRHNMGSDNGLQMQRSVPLTVVGVKAGQTVMVKLKSSSKNPMGISNVSNLEGEYGEEHYTSNSFKTYTFKVVEDGDASFTNSGGIVIQSIGLLSIGEDTRPQVETPVITLDGNRVTLVTSTEGATIYYSIVNHGKVRDYAREYNGPFTLDRSCRLRAIAVCEGMQDSEEAEQMVEIPLVMPFAGKPFELDPEKLGRGVVATYTSGGMLVNWRWLITDPLDITFNVCRNGIQLNNTPLTGKTNFLDATGKRTDTYTVEVIVDGKVTETATAMILANGYLDIPLNRPSSGSTVSGEFEYIPGDCMAADVDGDGEYEIVMKWDPSNQQDNSLSGYTGNVLVDCYRMTGEQLWRIDLGCNIRAGAHYTQLMVYDLDGDGRAEVACKTAPGTVDGAGKCVLLGTDDPAADYRTDEGDTKGVVINGPEYLTVFSGLTGEALSTVPYQPARNVLSDSDWGDSYGNRCERYLACVAYLDGVRPTLVMCRGYYTAAFLWAVDFDGTSLTTRWLHSSVVPEVGAYGEGAHSISVADVDGDLRDEIIYGACAIDDDGSIIYRTGWGHGDAMHVGDHNPDRPGLEVMMVHEETAAKYGVEMHDALTGELVSGYYTGTDVGRGLCADVDANVRGSEFWSTADNGVYAVNGEQIGTKRPSVNFRTYWDGDVLEEFCEKGKMEKLNHRTSISTLVNFSSKYGAGTNLIKDTPCLQADIFGDWREEVIYYDNETKSHLQIFSTPYATTIGVPTLMHDHQYRMATVWQTSAYNQPPHLSYFLPDYVKHLQEQAAAIVDNRLQMEVQTVRYFNLLGQETMFPEGKVYIRETIYTNGECVREKCFR
ncbi:MAG: chitobiase/beta-hexosaminidase C-terminal domain-containing protein [Bacteroidaceae bacterium]|nr:chitobiase/beta-hexosaminidase C-terminal domain-containing protein [Bacteroidaceae bacterium]